MNVLAEDLRLRFVPAAFPLAWLAAPALLGVSRLLPATGFGLGLRLAAATACLLIPGAIVSRALRLEGLSPILVWSLAALFVGMALMFAVHGSIWLTLAVLVAVALVAGPLAARSPAPRLAPWSLGVLLVGLAAGIALWWVASYGGDTFFHLGRIRKLDDLGSLSLRTLDEYRDGGLHPGYAFPLWHGFLALVAKLAGVDPSEVVLHGPTVLLPLSFGLTYEAGAALFRSRLAGPATPSCGARLRTTPMSSTSSGCTATGSSPSSSGAPARSRSRRSSCCRWRSSRGGGSGRPLSSAGCCSASGSRSRRSSSRTWPMRSPSRRRGGWSASPRGPSRSPAGFSSRPRCSGCWCCQLRSPRGRSYSGSCPGTSASRTTTSTAGRPG